MTILQRKPSVKGKVKAQLTKSESKLRKKPKVTDQQRLQARIDTFTTQAAKLDVECKQLSAKAGTFAGRAETTKAPDSPPPDREPLFKRDSKAPPSQYEAQVKAREILLKEWRAFEKDVMDHGIRLDRFESTVDTVKGNNVKAGKAMGVIEHQFEGLDNAIFNLRNGRVDLSKAVAALPLPASKEKS